MLPHSGHGSWGTFARRPIATVLDRSSTVEAALSACAGLPTHAQVVIRRRLAGSFEWYAIEAGILRKKLERAQRDKARSLEEVRMNNDGVIAVDVTSKPPETLDGRRLLLDGHRVIALLDPGTRVRGFSPDDTMAGFESLSNDHGLRFDVHSDLSGIEPGDELVAVATEPTSSSAPPEQPARPETLATSTTAEQDTLYWNTWFPQDAATQRSGTVFVGIPYLLRTRLGTSPETGSLTQMTTTLEKLSQSGEPVDVTFRVEAKGAGVRLAGTQGAFGAAIESGDLRCDKGRGTPAFDVELMAEGAGPITIGLLLIVRNAVVFSEPVQLCAIETPPAPGSNAAAATLSHARLEGTRAASARLLVTRETPHYTMEAQVGALKSSPFQAASAFADIDKILKRCRGELVAASQAYAASDAGFGLARSKETMATFQKIGQELHRALFGMKGQTLVPQYVADWIANTGVEDAGRAPRLQIDAELLPFPWGILYDAPKTASPAQRGFWGCRFQIDRIVRFNMGPKPAPSVTLDLGGKALRAVIHPGLDAEQKIEVVDAQKDFFARRQAVAPAISHAELEALLSTQDPMKLLYFFCHAVTASTSLFRDDISTEQTNLQVDNVPLTVAAMNELREDPLPGSPLVFLNACSSAQGDSAYQSVFVDHFVNKWGARGVIGTDWKVPTIFADRFARLALEKLLVDGLTLGDAFHQTTMEAMKQGNPFGLIYAIYAPPEIVAIYPPENQP